MMTSRVAHQPRHGYRKIVSILRGRIVDGDYPVGARLPTQEQLQRKFRTTKVTLQRALDVLAADGFVQARGRRGTFVVDEPPHLNHYAMVFHGDPSNADADWSHFYATLVNEAAQIQQAEHRRIECFYGVNGPTGGPAYAHLTAKVAADQFAGLIFAGNPYLLRGTPVLEREGIPRVGLMSRQGATPMISAVEFSWDSWLEKAFAYLATCGRKRVAFVNKPQSKSHLEMRSPLARLAAHGLRTQPYWSLVLPLWTPDAEHGVQLLMQQAGERPDALVITDDNLVEPVVAGLTAAGARVPEDLTVVAHANFPRRGGRVLPFQWLGYDSHEVLKTSLAIIDQQRQGGTPPHATTIAAIFEEELPGNKNTAARKASPATTSAGEQDGARGVLRR